MRQPKPEHTLSLAEKQEVRGALDNGTLVLAHRKIMAEEAAYWGDQLKAEALKGNPNTNLMIQYSSRQAAAEWFETTIRKAVGL